MTWFRSNVIDPVLRSPGAKINLPEITVNCAWKLKTISPAQKVFLLLTQKGDFVVLKHEFKAFNKNVHASNYKAMGLVQKLASKPLTDEEVAAIRRWRVPNQPDWAIALDIEKNKTADVFWTKSNYVADEKNLKNLDTKYMSQLTGQKKIDAVAAILLMGRQLGENQRVWTQLGEIAAVDVFNGNVDRFIFDPGTYVKGRDYVQNFGNVMFREKDEKKHFMKTGKKTIRAVGLDAYDPSRKDLEFGWETEYKQFLNIEDANNVADVNQALSNIYQHLHDTICTVINETDLEWPAANLDAFKAGYFSTVRKLRSASSFGKALGQNNLAGQKSKAASLGWRDKTKNPIKPAPAGI